MTKTEVESKITALATKISGIKTCTALTDNTNFNDIPTNRLYQVFVTQGSAETCNAPTNACFLVYTYSNDLTTWKDLTIQFAICHTNETIYVRRRATGTWKTWKIITQANLNTLELDKPSIDGSGEMANPGTTVDTGEM